jgi:hypothetical protein
MVSIDIVVCRMLLCPFRKISTCSSYDYSTYDRAYVPDALFPRLQLLLANTDHHHGRRRRLLSTSKVSRVKRETAEHLPLFTSHSSSNKTNRSMASANIWYPSDRTGSCVLKNSAGIPFEDFACLYPNTYGATVSP